MIRQLSDKIAKFLKEFMSLPRESGPRIKAEVTIA